MVDIGGISLDFSALYSGALSIIKWVPVIGGGIAFYWWMRHRKSFTIDAEIWNVRHGALTRDIIEKGKGVVDLNNIPFILEDDKAAISHLKIGGKKISKLITKKNKVSMPGPDFNKHIFNSKGRPKIKIIRWGVDDYAYLTTSGLIDTSPSGIGEKTNTSIIDVAGFNLKPTDHNMRFWRQLEDRENELRYAKSSFWEKYGTQITMIATFTIGGVILWISLDYITNMVTASSNALSGAADKLIQACNGGGLAAPSPFGG